MGKAIDMTNKRFGRFTVLYRDTSSKYANGSIFWICKCDCGTVKSVNGVLLRQGKVVSCGCYHSEIMTHHGDNGTDFHNVWGSMKQRCSNPKHPAYKYYGERGISYDPRWEDYVIFKEDMYESYLEHIRVHGKKETTLDRIDNDGDYTPVNCTWSTHQEQQENTRVNYLFEAKYTVPGPSFGYKEQSRNQKAFAKKYGLTRKSISRALNSKLTNSVKGWVFKYV